MWQSHTLVASIHKPFKFLKEKAYHNRYKKCFNREGYAHAPCRHMSPKVGCRANFGLAIDAKVLYCTWGRRNSCRRTPGI